MGAANLSSLSRMSCDVAPLMSVFCVPDATARGVKNYYHQPSKSQRKQTGADMQRRRARGDNLALKGNGRVRVLELRHLGLDELAAAGSQKLLESCEHRQTTHRAPVWPAPCLANCTVTSVTFFSCTGSARSRCSSETGMLVAAIGVWGVF